MNVNKKLFFIIPVVIIFALYFSPYGHQKKLEQSTPNYYPTGSDTSVGLFWNKPPHTKNNILKTSNNSDPIGFSFNPVYNDNGQEIIILHFSLDELITSTCNSDTNDSINRLEHLGHITKWKNDAVIICLYNRYMLNENEEKALDIVETSTLSNTDNTAMEMQIKLAEAQSIVGDDALAEGTILKVLSDDPVNVDALGIYQNILQNQNRFDEYMDYINEIINNYPLNADVYQILASLARENMDTELAEEILMGAIDLIPDNPELKRALADQFTLQGRLSEAAELYEEYIRIAPDDPYGYFQLADIRQEKGDIMGASDLINIANKIEK